MFLVFAPNSENASLIFFYRGESPRCQKIVTFSSISYRVRFFTSSSMENNRLNLGNAGKYQHLLTRTLYFFLTTTFVKLL